MLFLNEDSPVRRLRTTRIIGKCDGCVVGCQWIENDLSAHAMPHFDDVVLHVRIFFITSAQWNIEPHDRHLIPAAGHFRHCRRRIIRRFRQWRFIGIINFHAVDIAFDAHQRGLDPARGMSADGFDINPLRVFASSNDLEIASGKQTGEI